MSNHFFKFKIFFRIFPSQKQKYQFEKKKKYYDKTNVAPPANIQIKSELNN